ncbi:MULTISPECIES: quinone oxidoreductase [unclassified Undibacterium]|uniref:quinone oxidoreductase family protein n=1 Tax=unclassified Undibacterium TaxID=2630295 RepID=UPI002AC8A0E9|nr:MULTISPECIES: quinone oxidoreductase [unclassified Undibacterium]MEB0141095.1 quinone oxidoreductase [Undibacterium sp. CCC2.1]MEB0174124.1 quinone oxidoreductase [Undibacterium sp. CCC1.1]MEB0177823.1 quinone oxidoreductase [Undibacterium sp. CCC3.4]MEB0217040.1 quinone oxidoreductase [Undibacterium sp. 5I2]WPX42000.1 quinone oxidoreductase [Undibacterium sp. CCC3.4]
MVKAVRMECVGGPEVMQYLDVELAAPGPGEILVRHHAVGLNYIDVYFRTGLYPQPLPAGLGMEAAGVVEAVGAGVTVLAVGDRVAYAGRPVGAYAEARVMPADQVVRLPAAISFETGAAMMLQGLTVEYLFHRTFPLQGGVTILFHAAAGGVGLIACQWARALGVTMIGTVGSEEKAKLAKENGCAHVINYNTENFVQRVAEITEGKGVAVVYDSIGKDTFIGSLDCLAPRGMMVSFGNASGPVPPFSLNELGSRGSLFITRPSLMSYTAKRADLEQMAARLFAMVESGKIKIAVNQRYALRDVAQAHVDLEARKTTGSTVLIP